VLVLNVLQADSRLAGYKEVEHCASEHNIYICSSSLYNPGGVARHLGWDSKDLRQVYDAGHRCSSLLQFALRRPTGVVRTSLGAASTMSDINAFVLFVQQTYLRSKDYKSRVSLPFLLVAKG
jgi:molybdenum cofactor sulfurtransferase